MFQTYLYMGKVPLRFSGSPPQTPMSKGGGSLLGDRAWKPLLMAPSSCKHAFDWLSCVVQPCEKPSTRHRRNTTIRQTIVGTRAMKAPGAMCNCTLQTLINDTWHKQLASPCGLPINISPKAYLQWPWGLQNFINITPKFPPKPNVHVSFKVLALV